MNVDILAHSFSESVKLAVLLSPEQLFLDHLGQVKLHTQAFPI